MNVPVTRIELDNAVNTEVRLKALGNEMVPLYEEHAARLEHKISLNDWEAMDAIEKALVIAARRIRIALENIQAEAHIAHAKRNAKRR